MGKGGAREGQRRGKGGSEDRFLIHSGPATPSKKEEEKKSGGGGDDGIGYMRARATPSHHHFLEPNYIRMHAYMQAGIHVQRQICTIQAFRHAVWAHLFALFKAQFGA